MARVVVSDLPRPRELRPSHFTPDTFTGAPKPVQDDDKQRLASALSAFGAALSGLAAGAAAKEKQAANQAATAEAYRTIAAESADPQFGQKVATGQYPVQATEIGSGLLMAEAGQRQARAATDAFQLGIKDGTVPLIDENGIPIPLEQAMRQHAARYMTVPGNPHFMKSFSTGLESVMTGFHEQQRNAVATYNRGRLEQLTKNGIEEVIGLAAGGADDDRVKQTWAGLTKQAFKVTGTDPATMDARWVGRLREMISSDDPKQWDVAERLLKLDRTGFDGQKLGPLGAKPEFRKDVEEFSNTLLQKRAGLYDRQVEDVKVREAVDALKRGDASFHGITDTAYVNPFVPGNGSKDPNRYVTASTIKQRAAAQYEAESLAELRRQSADPTTEPGAQQTYFERTYGAYVHNNIANPKWKATLEDATRSLSDPTSASDPNFAKKLLEGEKLYATLMERSPGYVQETLRINDRERRFYDMVAVYRDGLGQPPEVAVQSAIRHVNSPQTGLDQGTQAKIAEAVKKVDLKWGPGGETGSWWGPSWSNTEPVRREIAKVASAIAADKQIDPEKAVELAGQLVEKRTVLVNGQAVLSPHVTQEKVPWVQRLLDKTFKDYAPALKAQYDVSSASGLSIRPEPGGYFTVVTAEGEPVRVPVAGPDGSFSHRLLQLDAKAINGAGAAIREEMLGAAAADAQRSRDRAIAGGAFIAPTPRKQSPAMQDERKRVEAERQQRLDEMLPSLETWGAPTGPAGSSQSLLDALFGTSRASPSYRKK